MEGSTLAAPYFLEALNEERRPLRSGGALQDIAPTVLGMMGVPQPKEMTGRDLRVGASNRGGGWRLGVSPRTTRGMILRGDLAAVKLPNIRRILVEESALNDLIAASRID